MNISRVAVGVVVTILLTSSTLALAVPRSALKPLKQMRCADFLGYEDAAKPEIVYWAAIHDRNGRRVTDVIDSDETDRIVPVVVQKCRMKSEESLWKRVNVEMAGVGKQALEQKEARPRAD